MKKLLLSLFAAAMFMVPSLAQAEVAHSTVGVQGYDLVSYHSEAGPTKGNGNHLSTHNGVNYLFANKGNKEKFDKNPEQYLPAYGGWCAYGVSVGKKFVADPTVWKVVDGKLYLNLDTKIQKIWNKDVSGNITKADVKWTTIETKDPSDL